MTRWRRSGGRGAWPAARMLVAAGALPAVVTLSGGCFGSNNLTLGQQDLLGPGTLNFSTCVSQANSSCPNGGASNLFPTPTPGSRVQALVAVQVPSAYVMPETVLAPTDIRRFDWFTTKYTRSRSFADEATRMSPPNPGNVWVGYVSEATDSFSPGARYVGQIVFERPPAADGTPQPSGFRGVVWLGARTVSDTLPADRPVWCSIEDATICNDQGTAVGFGPNLHDLSILPLPAVTAARGTTAVLPVTVMFSGKADAKYTFALTATTSLAGTSATPNVPTLAPPEDSTTSLSVSVPVPQDAAPGTYAVTVAATLSTGETRSAKGSIVVPTPAGTPGGPPGGGASGGGTPSVALTTARGVTAKAARMSGIPVRITTDNAVRATISLSQVRRVRVARRLVSRSVVVARRTLVVLAGTTTVRVRGTGLRPGRVVVRITGTGFSAQGSAVLR